MKEDLFIGSRPRYKRGAQSSFPDEVSSLLGRQMYAIIYSALPEPPRIRKSFYIILFPICHRLAFLESTIKINYWQNGIFKTYTKYNPQFVIMIRVNRFERTVQLLGLFLNTYHQFLSLSQDRLVEVHRPVGSTGDIWSRADV